jgi:tetratricopeptide (TPR) repeat protein
MIVCFLIYQQTILFDFVLDDEAVITKNSFVKDGIKGIPNILKSFYWQGYWDENSGLYRPLSLIVFAVIWQITPGNPMLYHGIHLVIYLYSVFLLFRFLQDFLKDYSPYLSFTIVLLFALHPYHVEVVANIKSMDELLSFIFGIAATHKLWQNGKFTIKALIFFLLALLAKEGAVAFIPIWFFMLLQLKKYNLKRTILCLWPFLLVGIIWLTWRNYVINQGPTLISYTYRDNSILACNDWLVQKSTAIGMLGDYLFRFFFPAQMSYDYSFPQIPCLNLSSPTFLIAFFVLLLLLILAIKWFYSKPLASFGILFFFSTIFLTSNVFFIIGATMADRFMFTPIFGLIITGSYLLFEKAKMLQKFNALSRINLLLVFFVLLFFGFSIKHIGSWKNNETLFTSHVKNVPNSARAQFNYGTLLMQAGISGQKDSLPKAIKHLQIARNLDPKDQGNLINLGSSYYHLGDYRSSANTFIKVLNEKQDEDIYLNLADAYYKLEMLDSAAFLYQNALKKGIWHPNTHNLYGELFFRKGDFKTAERIFKSGIDKQANNVELWLNYGASLASQEKYNPAIIAFRKAYEIDPKYNQALFFIAKSYLSLGETSLAQQYQGLYMTSENNKKGNFSK